MVSYLAERLHGVEQGLRFLLLRLGGAVLHVGFPVARLELQVEGQTVRTSESLQSL